jgi:hypothetical protein
VVEPACPVANRHFFLAAVKKKGKGQNYCLKSSLDLQPTINNCFNKNQKKTLGVKNNI